MDSTKIDRINTLHHKAQSVGLTEEEKKENEKKQVKVPDVRNLTIKEATKVLEESNLESNLDTDIEVDEKKVVTDMFPKPGVKVNEGSSIILYYNNN